MLALVVRPDSSRRMLALVARPNSSRRMLALVTRPDSSWRMLALVASRSDEASARPVLTDSNMASLLVEVMRLTPGQY